MNKNAFFLYSFFVIIVTASGMQLKPENYRLKMNTDLSSLKLPGYFGISISGIEDEEQQATKQKNTSIATSIQTGINGTIFGTTIWSIGLILEITALTQVISTRGSYTMNESKNVTSLLVASALLNILGPLPSCLSESSTISEVNSNSGTSAKLHSVGWKFYGISWLFTGLGVLFVNSTSFPYPIIATSMLASGEALRGCAAIVPIGKLRSLKSSIHSQLSVGMDNYHTSRLTLVVDY